MRTFVGISLALVATVSAHSHDTHKRSSRKSLSFGPSHPHAIFNTHPPSLMSYSCKHATDPHRVADEYATRILDHSRSPGRSFVIRSDSYTDQTTGISHMYLRQLINGLEVVDGDINMNIHNGQVISFGDSFYRGKVPDPMTTHDCCTDVEDHTVTLPNGQVIFENNMAHRYITSGRTHSPTSSGIASPHVAALNFMIAAHPNDLVSADLLANFDSHLEHISSTFDTSLIGDHEISMQLLHNVPGTISPIKAKLAYVQTPNPDHPTSTVLNLVWSLEVEMQDNHYETTISAGNPTRIITAIDWAKDAPAPVPAPVPFPIPEPRGEGTYNVWAWGINDPESGSRSLQHAPFDTFASPLGWHSLPANKNPLKKSTSTEILNSTTTWGNNVFAQENWNGTRDDNNIDWKNNHRPEGGISLVFDYPYKENSPFKTYADASITQLFYTTNMVHDLYYRYGFDEVSGNFQQFNFGRGGKENDAIIALAQDAAYTNNAYFIPTPDGRAPKLRMFLFKSGGSTRDSVLDTGVLIHELTHGLSTRLTGGPDNSGCLDDGESGGMGEGWSDFLPTTIRSTSVYSDYPMGAWAGDDVNGIREWPYSTDKTINPSTYKTIDQYTDPHPIGAVWAEMLYIVSQRLIAKYGFGETLFPPKVLPDGTVPEGDFYRPVKVTMPSGTRGPLVPKYGNTLFVQLVINAMKLQPCRPKFFDARDAIIQADKILTGGENVCDIWKGFAERGLGSDATLKRAGPWGEGGTRTNGFSVPDGVCDD